MTSQSLLFFCLGSISAAGLAIQASVQAPRPRSPVRGKSLIREDTFTVDATPARVFPLLCPTLEYDWIPGWECDLLNSASGVAELECVFRTQRKDSGTMIWVVSRYEPPVRIEFTCVNAGTEHIMRLGIVLEPRENGRTALHWRRRWLSIGPNGDEVIDRFNESSHADLMHRLETMMACYLRTGRAMPPQ